MGRRPSIYISMTHCNISLVVAAYETLTVLGEARTYRLGDVFTMAAGCMHLEQIGLDGVEYRVVRTDPTTEP
jgi:hypothetical protein